MKTHTLPELPPITKAEFDALPNNEKAVLLAHDVIALLDAKKFIPERGTYYDYAKDGERQNLTRNSSAQKTICDESTVCYVCAKGSALAAYALRFNDISNYKLDDTAYDSDIMTEIFGHAEWNEMEDRFEHGNDSIREVMKRVIRNNGYYIAANRPKE